MLQGRFLASVVAPAGVAALPVLVIMAGYAMTDTTGEADPDHRGRENR